MVVNFGGFYPGNYHHFRNSHSGGFPSGGPYPRGIYIGGYPQVFASVIDEVRFIRSSGSDSFANRLNHSIYRRINSNPVSNDRDRINQAQQNINQLREEINNRNRRNLHRCSTRGCNLYAIQACFAFTRELIPTCPQCTQRSFPIQDYPECYNILQMCNDCRQRPRLNAYCFPSMKECPVCSNCWKM